MKKNIERMSQKKWGVFSHYLNQAQNNKDSILSYGKETDWDTCVHEFDVELLAKQLHEAKAGYYFITTMQYSRYMIAPNATYDKIAGTKPGEACSTRDLIEDLYNALSKYDIDLYLYCTGDGPFGDPEIGAKFNYTEPREDVQIPDDFIEKWASVMEEYSVRYGDKIKGWWIDGCYDWMPYTNEKVMVYKKAIEKGNPDAIVSFNNATNLTLCTGFVPSYDADDYTAGEALNFVRVPEDRFTDGKLGHILSGLGWAENPYGRWGQPGLAYGKQFMFDYVEAVSKVGAVVTIDVATYRDGKFDEEQMEVLKYIGENLK